MFGGVSKTPVLKGAASKGHKNSGSERQPGSSDKTQNTIKGFIESSSPGPTSNSGPPPMSGPPIGGPPISYGTNQPQKTQGNPFQLHNNVSPNAQSSFNDSQPKFNIWTPQPKPNSEPIPEPLNAATEKTIPLNHTDSNQVKSVTAKSKIDENPQVKKETANLNAISNHIATPTSSQPPELTKTSPASTTVSKDQSNIHPYQNNVNSAGKSVVNEGQSQSQSQTPPQTLPHTTSQSPSQVQVQPLTKQVVLPSKKQLNNGAAHPSQKLFVNGSSNPEVSSQIKPSQPSDLTVVTAGTVAAPMRDDSNRAPSAPQNANQMSKSPNVDIKKDQIPVTTPVSMTTAANPGSTTGATSNRADITKMRTNAPTKSITKQRVQIPLTRSSSFMENYLMCLNIFLSIGIVLTFIGFLYVCILNFIAKPGELPLHSIVSKEFLMENSKYARNFISAVFGTPIRSMYMLKLYVERIQHFSHSHWYEMFTVKNANIALENLATAMRNPKLSWKLTVRYIMQFNGAVIIEFIQSIVTYHLR